ncbi:MAG: GNAT family N-acetyltransferase [Geothrix sp.]|uniref:GNAT family N-acetyltransferase n=1 Tax=Geothrix sp. TaxID=1962974 RepID=UPI0017C911F9|nr:GNAT family N-acetyltransferase [Geothrix sp.]NWJ42560.1 GNAT family N-acetyltransferase [Geothrix sp.]WIL19480.1 MAG: GNAT family N-acetyltransferase [Geothrix sp.]
MNADVFAEWMRRQGYRVVRTESSYWYNAAPGVLQAFPYHWVITPSASEIRPLMMRHGILAVRYSTPFEFTHGVASYHITLREPYSLDQLKAQARNGVKTGLDHFQIERIPFERLATEGWLLQQDTLDRQGRLRSMTRETWERLCRSASDLDGFEAWAATSDGELAAAVIVARQQSIFSVPFAMSHRRFLGNHVNNALFYAVSKELLGREGIESLFYTVQSLDAPANVDEFKFRMGLQIKFVRQCVDFNPLIRPFATPMAHRFARKLLQQDPSNPHIAKAEGMLRFHLEGRKPIGEQAWPERLLAERSMFLPPSKCFRKLKDILVTSATPFDINALVDLHGVCFSKHEHIPVRLGRPFLMAVYRWFVSSPDTSVLVARQGGRLVGFTTLSDHPYNLPMLWACRREMFRSYLRHPSALFDLELFQRLGGILANRLGGSAEKVAQIAFTGVDPAFQGQGIGKALKAASISVCRERGMVAISTGVRRQNQRARRLNEQAGFVEVPSLSTRRLVYLRLDLRD